MSSTFRLWSQSDPAAASLDPTAILIVLLTPISASLALWQLGRGFRIRRNDLQDSIGPHADRPEVKAAYAADRVARVALVLTAVGAACYSTVCEIWLRSTEQRYDLQLSRSIIAVTWIRVALQAIALVFAPQHRTRSNVGALCAVDAALVAVFTAGQIFGTSHALPEDSDLWVLSGHVVFGLAVFFSALAPRRRPVQFYHDRPIDDQNGASLLSTLTFAWFDSIQKLGRSRGYLTDADLPYLERTYRTSRMLATFRSEDRSSSTSLWWLIIKSHWRGFALQYFVTAIGSVAMFGPQLCMLTLLSLFEQRDAAGGQTSPKYLWVWAILMVLSKAFHCLVESWVQWVNRNKVQIPIRAQLTGLIFEKCLSIADIKDAVREEKVQQTEPDSDNNAATESDPLLAEDDKKGATEAEEPPAEKAEQSGSGVNNLVTVDAERVALFCWENTDVSMSFVKILIGGIFLVKVIGIWSTLAGFVVPVIVQPLTKIVTSRYTKATLHMMAARDSKVHVVSEALDGIRQIKVSATEKHWQRSIRATREAELAKQKRVFYWASLMLPMWITMPIFISLASLTTYVLLHGSLSATVAFTSLAIFNQLEFTFGVAPAALAELFDAIVSAKRIENHLFATEDKQEYLIDSTELAFDDADISWPSARKDSDTTFVMRDLSLYFPAKQLSVILGKTGSGKSLLLAGISGEAHLRKGRVFSPTAISPPYQHHISDADWIVPGHRAFVAQTPWIENTTIEKNILYGLPKNAARYQETIRVCALEHDLATLDGGDQTEVGATGINLSGGQRWRLTLARAIYSRAGVLILDDIFSAVDAHIGRQILEQALLGPLCSERTVVLATHHAELVKSSAACIVELGSGGVVSNITTSTTMPAIDRSGVSTTVQPPKPTIEYYEDEQEDLRAIQLAQEQVANVHKLTGEEGRARGAVTLAIWKAYIKAAGGYVYWAILISIFATASLLLLARSYWIKIWTQSMSASSTGTLIDLPTPKLGITGFLIGYLFLCLITTFFITLRIVFNYTGSLRASRNLFEALTSTILHAKMRWLDTTPTGRILNRFVGDFAQVDSRLCPNLQWTLSGVFSILASMIAAVTVSWYTIFPIIILNWINIYIAGQYLMVARDLKRLESTSKSPIFDQLSSVTSGLSTIRTFGRAGHYVRAMCRSIDTNARASFYLYVMVEWMALREQLVGVLFLLIVAAGLIMLRDTKASLAGFALSFGLEYAFAVVHTVFRIASLELDMSAAERIVEYINTPQETTNGTDVPDDWPSKGAITVTNLAVTYAPELPPALKNLTFQASPRERVGVVGRTGSGKSTLTLSLFRLVQQIGGSIEIDGIDILKPRLADLRSRLTIIPQHPVLFTGTLRSNLDPQSEHSDFAIYRVLRQVHLLEDHEVASTGSSNGSSPHPTNPFADLSYSISRGGLNLSQGQRQLLCLARAILCNPKILILDEATSAVDMETDKKIQTSIRESFQESTLLVIAHRLSTVVDFDKVLVVGEGKSLEFGSPWELYQKQGGDFRQMIEMSGEREVLERVMREKAASV